MVQRERNWTPTRSAAIRWRREGRNCSRVDMTATGGITRSTHGVRYLAEYAPLLDGSAAMRSIRFMVENIADTDATVLIRGESGVGKDFVARAIHAASRRCDGPFIKVN